MPVLHDNVQRVINGLIACMLCLVGTACRYLHECLRDPDSLTIRPNNFTDLEHHVVVSALVVAVALLRDNMVSPHVSDEHHCFLLPIFCVAH